MSDVLKLINPSEDIECIY